MEPVFFRSNQDLVQIDSEEGVRAAMEQGLQQVTPEEAQSAMAKEEYIQGTPRLQRELQGAALGAAEGALALPALASNVLPGVDGQSGGSWMADLAAATSPHMTTEEAEEAMRIIREGGATGYAVGELAGSMATGSIASAGLKGGIKFAAGRAAARQAATATATGGARGAVTNYLASDSGAALAGFSAESAATSVAQANEMAWRDGNELTPEIAAMAAIFGAAGPIGFKMGLAGVKAGGARLAGRVDDARLANWKDGIKAAEQGADDAFGKAVEKEANAYTKAYDKAYSSYESGISRRASAAEKAAQKEIDAYHKSLDDYIAKAEKRNPTAPRYGESPAEFEARRSANARLLLDQAQEEIKPPAAMTRSESFADQFKRESPFQAPEAPGIPQRPSISHPDAPVMLKGLFGERPEQLSTFGKLTDSLSDTASRMKQEAMEGVSHVGGVELKRGLKNALGLGYTRGNTYAERGMRTAALAFDSILAPMAQSAAGKVVTRFGSKAQGIFFDTAANSLRALSRGAAEMGKYGQPRVSPLGLITNAAGRVGARERVGAAYREMVNETASIMADQQAFVESMGSTFAPLQSGSGGKAVPAMMQQYGRAIQYMQQEQPAQVPRIPGMPKFGFIEPSLEKQESYVRKMIAVRNPLTLVDELEHGIVSRDTVHAVSSVYPSLYFDMVQEVSQAIANRGTPMKRHEELAMQAFMSGSGAVFGAQAPRYMARLHESNQALSVQHRDGQGQGQGGGQHGGARTPKSTPTLAQDMRTASQSSTQSIYNR